MDTRFSTQIKAEVSDRDAGQNAKPPGEAPWDGLRGRETWFEPSPWAFFFIRLLFKKTGSFCFFCFPFFALCFQFVFIPSSLIFPSFLKNNYLHVKWELEWIELCLASYFSRSFFFYEHIHMIKRGLPCLVQRVENWAGGGSDGGACRSHAKPLWGSSEVCLSSMSRYGKLSSSFAKGQTIAWNAYVCLEIWLIPWTNWFSGRVFEQAWLRAGLWDKPSSWEFWQELPIVVGFIEYLNRETQNHWVLFIFLLLGVLSDVCLFQHTHTHTSHTQLQVFLTWKRNAHLIEPTNLNEHT